MEEQINRRENNDIPKTYFPKLNIISFNSLEMLLAQSRELSLILENLENVFRAR
jgi:hypothetical protein